MSAEQTIIIKRPKVVAASGHHGGAWKVAYADFVTAMMAFFLLMWLLNATTEEQRRGLADYFNPSIPIAAVSGGGKGALKGDMPVQAEGLSKFEKPGEKSVSAGDLQKLAPTPPQDAIDKALEAALGGEAAELSDHITIRMSPEGLTIELTDRDARPLFARGRADPSPVLRKLCAAVAVALEGIENPLKIVGHTDSTAFAATNGYSNWELSSDRANVARRLMKDAGMPADRVHEVSGRAATMPLIEDPLDPRNRRISITLVR